MTKPILIGELNPYGPDPEFAMYPSPRGCAGWRLCHLVLKMDPDDYLEAFDRRNLLVASKWSAPRAREAAAQLVRESNGAPLILLGAKVAAAFILTFQPFSTGELPFRFAPPGFSLAQRYVMLPHPSGLCREACYLSTSSNAR